MKTETLLVLIAVGAVVYFATRQPAPAPTPVVVQRGESTAQTAIKAGAGLAGDIIGLFRDSGANQQSSVSG